MARRPPAIRSPLHAHELVMAEPRRAVVRRTDQQEAQTRHTPLRPRAQQRHPPMDRNLEREPTPLHLGQNRRPNPRIHSPLLRTTQRLTTLAELLEPGQE